MFKEESEGKNRSWVILSSLALGNSGQTSISNIVAPTSQSTYEDIKKLVANGGLVRRPEY